jgi:hypothetical protein
MKNAKLVHSLLQFIQIDHSVPKKIQIFFLNNHIHLKYILTDSILSINLSNASSRISMS